MLIYRYVSGYESYLQICAPDSSERHFHHKHVGWSVRCSGGSSRSDGKHVGTKHFSSIMSGQGLFSVHSSDLCVTFNTEKVGLAPFFQGKLYLVAWEYFRYVYIGILIDFDGSWFG